MARKITTSRRTATGKRTAPPSAKATAPRARAGGTPTRAKPLRGRTARTAGTAAAALGGTAPSPESAAGPRASESGQGKQKKKSMMKEKQPGPKVERDSFTMPAHDYALIAELKKKCLALGVSVKKSELLRAGLRLLGAMAPDALVERMKTIESVKTGRPSDAAKPR